MELILIRHIAWDKKKDKITEEGRNQIRIILENLEKHKFCKIYSSPTKRAVYLAKIITRFFNKELIIDALLKERNEGSIKDERTIELMAKKNNVHYVEFRPPNGESVIDVLGRTKRFLQKINKNECSIVIVTHYINILCFYSIVKNVDIKTVWDEELIDPECGEIVVLKKDGRKKCRVLKNS